MKPISAIVIKSLQAGSYIKCVAGNTPIIMNPRVDNIKNVESGMSAAGHNGFYNVSKTYKRIHRGEIISIKPRGLPAIEFTPEHPIFVTKFKRYKPHRGPRQILISTSFWTPASEVNKNCLVGIPRIKNIEKFSLTFEKGHKKEKVKVTGDKELFELFGWYLSEGCSSDYNVIFSLGKHEDDNIVRIKELIEKKLGLKAHIYTVRTAKNIVAINKDLSKFFRTSFGEKAPTKRIPTFVFYAEKEHIISFLRSFIKGDGHIAPYGIRFNTSSKTVAFQLLLLLAKIGIRGFIYEYDRKSHYLEGRKIKGKTIFEIRVTGKQADIIFKLPKERRYHRNVPVDDDFVYYPVDSIKKRKDRLQVFNLETASGVFCVPFLVHNCADNSGATLLQIIAVKGYKGVKGRSPRCGVGNWIICAVKDGNSKIKHEVVHAIIIRQKKEYRRKNGLRVKFEDNAAVLINDKGEPRGTKIKGPIAKEVVERFSMIGKIATTVL